MRVSRIVLACASLCWWLTDRPLAHRQTSPVSVVVLVDVSVSVANTLAPFVWDGTKDSAGRPQGSGTRPPSRPADLFTRPLTEGVLPRVRPSDYVRLGTVGKNVRIGVPLSGGRPAMVSAVRYTLNIPDEDRYGPSPLWDAVDAAVDALSNAAGSRSIILVTDGLSSGNRLSLSQVTQSAIQSRTSIHIVHEEFSETSFGKAFSLTDRTSNPWLFLTAPIGRQPGAVLGALALATGGTRIVDDSGGTKNLSSLLGSLLDAIQRSAEASR